MANLDDLMMGMEHKTEYPKEFVDSMKDDARRSKQFRSMANKFSRKEGKTKSEKVWETIEKIAMNACAHSIAFELLPEIPMDEPSPNMTLQYIDYVYSDKWYIRCWRDFKFKFRKISNVYDMIFGKGITNFFWRKRMKERFSFLPFNKK